MWLPTQNSLAKETPPTAAGSADKARSLSRGANRCEKNAPKLPCLVFMSTGKCPKGNEKGCEDGPHQTKAVYEAEVSKFNEKNAKDFRQALAAAKPEPKPKKDASGSPPKNGRPPKKTKAT